MLAAQAEYAKQPHLIAKVVGPDLPAVQKARLTFSGRPTADGNHYVLPSKCLGFFKAC
jgi:hypothetical protein